MRLILVRHGETQQNAADVVQGHLPGRLSAKGRDQASMLAAHLKGEDFSVLYSSDLERALETARPLSLTPAAGPVVKDERLREQAFGVYEGRPIEELRDHMRRDNVSWQAFHPPGGESRSQLEARAASFVREIQIRHASQTVVAVTHYGVINATLRVEALGQFRSGDQIIANASLTIINFGNGDRAELEIVNFADHLGSLA